jgi:hypothetical protein
MCGEVNKEVFMYQVPYKMLRAFIAAPGPHIEQFVYGYVFLCHLLSVS